jgi:hypothetical protein
MSMIKDKMIFYASQMEDYHSLKEEYQRDIYDENQLGSNCRPQTAEDFEKNRLEKVKWSYDQWKMYYHKHQAVSEILEIIDTNFNNA